MNSFALTLAWVHEILDLPESGVVTSSCVSSDERGSPSTGSP